MNVQRFCLITIDQCITVDERAGLFKTHLIILFISEELKATGSSTGGVATKRQSEPSRPSEEDKDALQSRGSSGIFMGAN